MDTKDTNPKDAIGSTKLSLSLVPDTMMVAAAVAFAEGDHKYRGFNWRIAGVRHSIYWDALGRHAMKYQNGEMADPKTGVPHLASMLACIGIIIDAAACNMLDDDRPPPAPLGEMIEKAQGNVRDMKEMLGERKVEGRYTRKSMDSTKVAAERAAEMAACPVVIKHSTLPDTRPWPGNFDDPIGARTIDRCGKRAMDCCAFNGGGTIFDCPASKSFAVKLKQDGGDPWVDQNQPARAGMQDA